MPITRKTLLLSLFFIFFSITKTFGEDLKKIGNFMVAQYNSPWALPPFRHNEIMVRISR